ncbi:hypothetical protein LguiA_021411 [Lonicera macranthoides]
MTDPVTVTTGITYDRQSIEHWLLTAEDVATCPVTKQPLPRDSDLTQNHTLRRLIQAWCTNIGIARIPTPKPTLSLSLVLKLHRDLKVPERYMMSLNTMEKLVNESEKNRKCMIEAGTAKAMTKVVIRCFKEGKSIGLDEAMRILSLTLTPENKDIVEESSDIIDAIIWVLKCKIDAYILVRTKTNAILVLTMVIEFTSSSLLERLKPEFYKVMVNLLRDKVADMALKGVLRVLVEACSLGQNRMKIVENGAVTELVEIEMENTDKHVTELIFCLLGHLCSCANGREEFLNHAGGIALVAERILRVSDTTDDHAIQILGSIARFSATNLVSNEMLKVGAVSKLCMVLQSDCASHVKKRAREILRLHNNAWRGSPCYCSLSHNQRWS